MALPWLALIETWAVARLIRSPTFNRAVHRAYRKINRLPPNEPQNGLGRTGPSTFDHFTDELKTQLRELTWRKRPPKQ
ncbi:hypothetical protein K458DRAFT_394256 [Lentithecium fluviatile CBS 122367]|uniref:Uncharacterized protein n=1 Tax=Lentithecium fluviatile CBS 122367 TaxID=1168545 RepID=A0A6G1IM96_9PLEO|nr:hypothetical protein K458DRAFT_394256 [Lentithecium fluviatile CBS 122367]